MAGVETQDLASLPLRCQEDCYLSLHTVRESTDTPLRGFPTTACGTLWLTLHSDGEFFALRDAEILKCPNTMSC